MSCSRVRRDTLQIQVHCSGIQRDTPQTQCFVCFTVPHLLLYVLSRFFFFLSLNIKYWNRGRKNLLASRSDKNNDKVPWRKGIGDWQKKCQKSDDRLFHALWRKDDISLTETDFLTWSKKGYSSWLFFSALILYYFSRMSDEQYDYRSPKFQGDPICWWQEIRYIETSGVSVQIESRASVSRHEGGDTKGVLIFRNKCILQKSFVSN